MLVTFSRQAEVFSGIAKVTCRSLVLAKSVPDPATQNFICPVNEESGKKKRVRKIPHSKPRKPLKSLLCRCSIVTGVLMCLIFCKSFGYDHFHWGYGVRNNNEQTVTTTKPKQTKNSLGTNVAKGPSY